MGKRWDRLTEWATNVNEGTTLNPKPEELVGDWVKSSDPGPSTRVRRAMIVYASARDPRRWNRLNRDYAWLEATMEEMGMNPKDARFLL